MSDINERLSAESVATTDGIDMARHVAFCHNSRCLACAPDEVKQQIETVWERYERRLIDGWDAPADVEGHDDIA